MLFVLISIIMAALGIMFVVIHRRVEGDSQQDKDNKAWCEVFVVFCFALALVPMFTAISLHVGASIEIAKIEAYCDANFQIDKLNGQETLASDAKKYNLELAELRQKDRDIWIGVAFPHVPKDLDYIQAEDMGVGGNE